MGDSASRLFFGFGPRVVHPRNLCRWNIVFFLIFALKWLPTSVDRANAYSNMCASCLAKCKAQLTLFVDNWTYTHVKFWIVNHNTYNTRIYNTYSISIYSKLKYIIYSYIILIHTWVNCDLCENTRENTRIDRRIWGKTGHERFRSRSLLSPHLCAMTSTQGWDVTDPVLLEPWQYIILYYFASRTN